MPRLLQGQEMGRALFPNCAQVQRGTSGLGPGAEFVGGIDWL